MTADELLQLAVNVANGWSLEDLGLDETENSTALNKMLTEIHSQILRANREAVGRAAASETPEVNLAGEVLVFHGPSRDAPNDADRPDLR